MRKPLLLVSLASLLAACSGGGFTASHVTPQALAPTTSTVASSTTAVSTLGLKLLREFRPIGGYGSVVPNSPELYIVKPQTAFVDGPNARMISNVIAGAGCGGPPGTDCGQSNDPRMSDWLYVFGQFVDHDLDLEATPLTNPRIDIPIIPGDPFFPDGTTIAMNRATRFPGTNTLVNTTAGFLDLSQLYGSDAATAASLSNHDGTLKTSASLIPGDNEQYLPIVGGMFTCGDPRCMENPELTETTTLFLREHNYWVKALKAKYPEWDGNELYGMAKAITTAEYQNIIYTEYLPHLIGSALGPYGGYDGANAQVTDEFSTAVFRVGHSQISDTQEGLDDTGKVVFSEPLAKAFFNTPLQDETNGIDNALRNLGSGGAQATDPFVVAALRDLLVAGLVGGGKDAIDLIAIDIQRERDAGLGSLNETRQALGLAPYTDFSFVTPAVAQGAYQAVYKTPDKVDLFMGGLAEAHVAGGLVGETFNRIIADQFRRLRSGDRFWWEHEFQPGQPIADLIARTTLADIVKRNTNTTSNFQPDLFIATQYPVPSAPRPANHMPHPREVNGNGHRGFQE